MTAKNERGSGAKRTRQPTNLIASINQRLLNLAREQHEEFQFVLTRYALERLLYRLGQSEHAREFIVKGALLYSLWNGGPHRPTRDLDLLGQGSSDARRLEEIFREFCRVPVEDDALSVLTDTVCGAPIREHQEYSGLRIHILAMLGKARIPLQIDVGFGDAVTPAPSKVVFPTLLDMPAPHVFAYPRETVVAEKFQALVQLGMANTRMKDFYDLWILSQHFMCEGATLARAIRATFARRRTALPVQLPIALTTEFAVDTSKQTQWKAFLRKGKLEPATLTLSEVTDVLQQFLMQPAWADEDSRMYWPPRGPWQPQDAQG
jgi:predicted nucleotidyltransferase component of viral defense system